MKSAICDHFLAPGILWLLAFACSHQAAIAQAPVLLPAEQTLRSTGRDRAFNLLLDEGGWSSEACRAWWVTNERRLNATAEVAPDLVEKEVRLLCQMQPKKKVLSLIEKHPEAAGVLLLAHKKDALAAAILNAPESDRDMLVASYLFSTTGTEVEEWTQAVARHPGPIALFQRRCAALPYHGLFSYLEATSTMQPDAREIYGKWLDEVLALPVMDQSDERMHSRLSFAATCGLEVRRRLQSDSAFRQSFLKDIWPRFRDSMIHLTQNQGKDSQDVFIFCGGEPLVWDFFKRQDSELLFRQVGMDAVLLLAGPDALHPDLQKLSAAMWSKGNLELPHQMLEYHGNAHFLALVLRLQAEADWPLLNDVCLRLREKGAQWPAEAAHLEKLSKSVLKKDIHPPEASIIPGDALWSLGTKFLDGRRVGASDWLGAGLDIADIAVAFATVGGSKALTTAAKESLQQTLRSASRKSVGKLTGRAVNDLSKKQSTEWTQDLAQEALKMLPDKVRNTMIKTGCVEITAPVKTGFQLSRNLGLGRNPFKKLTGLEPRVFMRQDGRVFINFTNVITKPSPAASFLTRTLENGVLHTPPVEEGAGKAAAFFHQWKEDVSAWWSGHATGQL
jgi:hypothetical protein